CAERWRVYPEPQAAQDLAPTCAAHMGARSCAVCAAQDKVAIMLTAALLLAAQIEMHDHAHHDERLGTVSFASSCSATAQPMITRGVALLHSFWYEASE